MLIVLVGAVVLSSGSAATAFAHASLVVASPAAGIGLPQAPAAVVLRFDEPLNITLSSIAVDDVRGRDVAVGGTALVPGDRLAMKRRLGLVTVGVYMVRWTSVALDDGHALHGSYLFGVGASPLGNESVAAGPTATEGWLGLLGRWLGLLGLLAWIGTALLAGLAVRAGVAPRRVDRLLLAVPISAVLGLAVAALSEAEVATGRLSAVASLLTAGTSSRWRLAGLVLPLLGVAARLGTRTGEPRLRGYLVPLLGVCALYAEAAQGHAASAAQPALATGLLTVHLGAVAVWIGAITLGVLAGRRAVINVLGQMTPAAVLASVVVAVTGVGNATQELSSPGQLSDTSYGRAVLGKVVALTLMAALGLTHYRLRRGATPHVGGVRRAVRGELLAAVLAVAVATVLVGYPDAPRAAVVTAEQSAARPPLAGLTAAPAVAVAASAGPFVLGWSLSPPRPGRVRVVLTVVGAQPGDGLRDAQFSARLATGPPTVRASLAPCGYGCFTSWSTLARPGQWVLTVSVRSNRGSATATRTVPFPTPDGGELFTKMLAAMGRLHSLTMSERLRGSATSATVVSHYRLVAPDAMALSVDGAGDTVLIGADSYTREGPAARWQHSGGGLAFGSPAAFYRSEFTPAAAIRVLRSDAHVIEIAFARADITAWFTVEIDPHTYLLRAMHMRAEGHLMDDTVLAVDPSITIRAPLGAATRP